MNLLKRPPRVGDPNAADSTAATSIEAHELADQVDRARSLLLTQREGLISLHNERLHDLERIRNQAISDKEVGELIRQQVDSFALAYVHGPAMVAGLNAFRRPRGDAANLRLLDAGQLGADNGLEKIALGVLGGNPQPSLPWFCFYFGDVLKSRLSDLFADDQPPGVTTIRQRREEIATLNAELQQIEAELKQNEDALARLGHRFFGQIS